MENKQTKLEEMLLLDEDFRENFMKRHKFRELFPNFQKGDFLDLTKSFPDKIINSEINILEELGIETFEDPNSIENYTNR